MLRKMCRMCVSEKEPRLQGGPGQFPRPLADVFPRLCARIGPIGLADLPTPLERLGKLGGQLGRGDLFVKRDDLSSSLYGGNKPRKLEFLLGDALRRGAETVVTMGALGSNHLLATALHARRLGLRAAGVVFPQPLTRHVLRNLSACRGAGVELRPVASKYLLPLGVARTLGDIGKREGRKPVLVPGGGSSPLGVLGFVNAGLELAEQLRSLGLEAPREIFLAWGTGGTAVGLVLGLRLANLDCRVRAVRVIDRLLANRLRLGLLERSTVKLLGSAGDRVKMPGRARLVVEGKFLGAGYGYPTPAGGEAMEFFERQQGLLLEDTYTGKAAAAFLAAARGGAPGPLLYWHTLSSADVEPWVQRGISAEKCQFEKGAGHDEADRLSGG